MMNMQKVSNGIFWIWGLLTPTVGHVTYVLSPRCQVRNMSSETYHLLAHMICIRYPVTPIHCQSDHTIVPNSLPLEHTVTFFKYIVINSKWYFMSQTVRWNKSSLVHVVIPGPFPKNAYGEVLEIRQIDQDFWNTGYSLWFTWVW